MERVLPPLPYSYDALEPYIDAATMEIHHTKHHQAYINNLNSALSTYPELQKKPLSALLHDLNALPHDIRQTVRNNGGGDFNHTMFWQMMSPHAHGEPRGMVMEQITKQFGSFAQFQEQFNAAAKGCFGSGWAWLCVDDKRQLIVTSTVNQDSPVSQGLWPILGLDVWEHAYYLKYQNRRPDYISAWWRVIHWEYVHERYEMALK